MTQAIETCSGSMATGKSFDSAQGAYTLLHLLFSLVPIAAGADKFTNLLTNWQQYIAPLALNIVPVSPAVFMGAVGVIEIAAGILVALKPRIGAPIVAVWLALIAVNLFLTGHYFDVAVRDLGLAVAATALFLLSKKEQRSNF